MARARHGLASAVTEILARHGSEGKKLSFRQAERLTGLAPATISELAKGNARTPETVRRFATGMNVDVNPLLLLAGFVPEDDHSHTMAVVHTNPARPLQELEGVEIEPEEREWLGRFGRALALMPPGRERELWKESLRRDTELIETFLERLTGEK